MAINEVTSIDVKTLPPFKRLIMTIGELPTSYLESMTYAELLMWFCNFLQEKVLPTINNNADALQEVITYLENLDLQDEVNNKLDEMSESGQLQEIVADYLNSKAIFGFDTVSDMKLATNFINGSYAETLGFYAKNDGGNALYKIRTAGVGDVIDEMFILSLADENLIAELVIDENTNIKKIGAKADNDTSNVNVINAFIDKLNKLIIPDGQYVIDDTIEIADLDEVKIDGIINYTGNNYAFNMKNTTRKKYFINEISSSTGSGIEIDNGFTFNNLTVNNFNVKKNCIYLDATDGPTTVNNYYGNRWYSETEDCVYMFINSTAVSGTFLTENNFHDMDFWTDGSSKRAVYTRNLTNDHEIQYNLYGVNLESTSGLKHVGKIDEIGLYNCRTDEIVHTDNWLSFDGTLPNKVAILGNGPLFPSKIQYLNISSPLIYLDTNLTIEDASTNTQFRGGAILSKDIFRPKIHQQIIKSLTGTDFTTTTVDEVTTGTYTYSFVNGANYINFLNLSSLTGINKIEITIPYITSNDIVQDGFIIHIPAGLTALTLKRNGGGSRTINTPARGAYKFIPFYNGFLYTFYEDNY